MTRRLHLAGFVKPAGEHLAGWRHPDTPARAGTDLPFIRGLTRELEEAGFAAIFIPDLAGLPDAGPEVLERVAVVNDSLEPITLLAALAATTRRIGLIGTISTTYASPETIAHRLASLDRISHGRAGWNIVTSLNDAEARNHGHEHHPAHAERYRRAEEVVDEVRRLWDAAPAADVPVPPQGHPVLAQAGSSGPGRALAGRVADLVFTRSLPPDQARARYLQIKAEAERFGRDPALVHVLPELPVVVAPTRGEAEDRLAAVRDLLHPNVALADVAYWLGGADLAGGDLDAALPALPEGNASLGAREEIYRHAARDGLTVRDLARLVAAGDGAVVGDPREVADHIEEAFTTRAADGFTVSFPWQPETLVSFTRLVVPELRHRGLLDADEEGCTLRDRLGLPRP